MLDEYRAALSEELHSLRDAKQRLAAATAEVSALRLQLERAESLASQVAQREKELARALAQNDALARAAEADRNALAREAATRDKLSESHTAKQAEVRLLSLETLIL